MHEYSMVCTTLHADIPSLMSRRRPSKLFSDIVIATVFASGVAKSTYAKLRSKKDILVRCGYEMKDRAVQQD